MARLTVLYLIAVSLAIFLVHDPRFLAAVLAVHLLALPFAHVRPRQLARMAWRLRFLFVFLVAVQTLFPPKSHFLIDWTVARQPHQVLSHTPGPEEWTAEASRGLQSARIEVIRRRASRTMGAAVGVYQIAQIFAMLLASAIVRSAGDGRCFLDGLRGLFVPRSAVEVIDACFAQLESNSPTHHDPHGWPIASAVGDAKKSRKSKVESRKRGGWPIASAVGDANDHQREGKRTSQTPRPIRSLLRGDVGWIVDQLEGRIGNDVISDATDDAGHDARLMTRITVVLMSLRMLRIAAGTGLTPGYQNVAVIPLLCLAADRTHRRWGATVVGTATGVLSVMLGLGRNGVFILPAHILPGILIDVGWRLVGQERPRILRCAILGAAAGFTRFTGMFLVLLLLDNPELLAAVPFISVGHVAFGALSSVVTVTLLKESRRRAMLSPHVSPLVPSGSEPRTSVRAD